MDIFEKAKTYGSFNNWLSNIPEEDLQYLCDITDKVIEELKNQSDIDSFEQMCALAMFFSGNQEATEDELQELFRSLIVFIACESNLRKGYMTKEGFYSMVPGEDTAKMRMTPKGEQSVRDMLNKSK